MSEKHIPFYDIIYIASVPVKSSGHKDNRLFFMQIGPKMARNIRQYPALTPLDSNREQTEWVPRTGRPRAKDESSESSPRGSVRAHENHAGGVLTRDKSCTRYNLSLVKT
jgi:hypothetical protein